MSASCSPPLRVALVGEREQEHTQLADCTRVWITRRLLGDVRVGRLLPAASHVLVYCLKGSRLLGEEKRPQGETMVACAFPASSLHFLPAGGARGSALTPEPDPLRLPCPRSATSRVRLVDSAMLWG